VRQHSSSNKTTGSECRPRHSPAEARRMTSWLILSRTPAAVLESKQIRLLIRTGTVTAAAGL
jgi:hypothetical protein